MKVRYTHQAQEQLKMIKNYIAQDNKKRALTYLQKLKVKIELLATYPYLGKVNPNFNRTDIRDWVVLGYKVIYLIEAVVFRNLCHFDKISQKGMTHDKTAIRFQRSIRTASIWQGFDRQRWRVDPTDQTTHRSRA